MLLAQWYLCCREVNTEVWSLTAWLIPALPELVVWPWSSFHNFFIYKMGMLLYLYPELSSFGLLTIWGILCTPQTKLFFWFSFAFVRTGLDFACLLSMTGEGTSLQVYHGCVLRVFSVFSYLFIYSSNDFMLHAPLFFHWLFILFLKGIWDTKGLILWTLSIINRFICEISLKLNVYHNYERILWE